MDVNEFIEQEVKRQVTKKLAANNRELAELQETVNRQKDELGVALFSLNQIQKRANYFAEVIQLQEEANSSLFEVKDEVLVVDSSSPFYHQTGNILSQEDGFVQVQFPGENEIHLFSISNPVQVRLIHKDDGTFVVLNIDGKPWKVNYNHELGLNIGDCVLIDPETKQIIKKGDKLDIGPICKVISVLEVGVEISDKNEKRIITNPKNIPLEEGDRVLVDSGYFSISKKIAASSLDRYKINTSFDMSWDQIGGLELAKQQVREAIELPFTNKEIYDYYNIKKDEGILLYGPPGCGKSLLARASATAIKQLHKDSSDSGYFYVKSPELLDKWVGATEQEIAYLFAQCRKHYQKHGYPAVLVFDEFEAIAPQRGTRKSSDVTDTIVPVFLVEMDGADAEHQKSNPIVFLMTNRPDMVDQAVIRSGRISRHIKIERPDADASLEILKIHAEGMPFQDSSDYLQMLAITVQDIFSKFRTLYRINNEYNFTFGDAINGAILRAIIEQAKLYALRRNLKIDGIRGIVLDDLKKAVQLVYEQQRGLNHTYDLYDFCEKVGIQPSNLKFERCFTNKD